MKGSLKEQGFITLLPFCIINLCESDKAQKNEKESEQREANFLGIGSVYKNSKATPLPHLWMGEDPFANIPQGHRIGED